MIKKWAMLFATVILVYITSIPKGSGVGKSPITKYISPVRDSNPNPEPHFRACGIAGDHVITLELGLVGQGPNSSGALESV
jgi:hypothetical protein